nr:hypothetical protein [Tanacetum cinerariifolium]
MYFGDEHIVQILGMLSVFLRRIIDLGSSRTSWHYIYSLIFILPFAKGADPSESSPPPVYVAPMVSLFLCSDDSESDTEIPERHVSPAPHDAMLARWRRRVALRSSSPTTSTLEIPTAPILPAPYAIVAPSSEFTLAPVVTQDSSTTSYSYSTRGGHSYWSTLPYLSWWAMTPRCSEAYLCWRPAPLSTMYPLTTSESLAEDSSFESSAGPSRKRCRSPAATV